MNEKEITIKVPEGKRAEWINGVLTLVDEQKKDDLPVTERIKTFDDACKELGEHHAFVAAFRIAEAHGAFEHDVIAYIKLRIIVAALNEGWEAKFTEEEIRYFPWFGLYTKEQYDSMCENDNKSCMILSSSISGAYFGLMFINSVYNASFSLGSYSSQLALRTKELADYAGRQFVQEWADFIFKHYSQEQ